MTLTVLHEVLSAMLFYTCFGRALKTNRHVKRSILIAYWYLGIVAVVSMFAPLAFQWTPDFVSISLLLAILGVQIVTAVNWMHGVPKEFVK